MHAAESHAGPACRPGLPWSRTRRRCLRTPVTVASADTSTSSERHLVSRRRAVGAAAACTLASCGCLSFALRTPLCDTFNARALAEGMASYETAIRPRKRALFAHLAGCESVVEIGAGGTPNVALFPACVRSYTAVEPNPAFRPYFERHTEPLAPRLSATLLSARAEQLPLPTASADAVVATLLLCTVADPLTVLSEASRVLRPGGVFLFIEHVAAQSRLKGPTNRAVAAAIRSGGRMPLDTRHRGTVTQRHFRRRRRESRRQCAVCSPGDGHVYTEGRGSDCASRGGAGVQGVT